MEKNCWRKPSLLCHVLENELTDAAKEFRNSMQVVKQGHQLTKDAFCRYERMVDLECKGC